MDLIDNFANGYAEAMSKKLYQKIPPSCKSFTSIEDLQSELMLRYLEKKDRYDGAKGNYKQFVYWTININSYQILDKLHKNYDKENKYCRLTSPLENIGIDQIDDNNEDVWTYAIITNNLIDDVIEEEMPNIVETGKSEIRKLCEKFSISYNDDNPIKSLVKVLNLTLNQYDETEFLKLDHDLRRRLISLSSALKARSISLTLLDNDKPRTIGIANAIKRILKEKGNIPFPAIEKILEKEFISFNKSSAMSITSVLRRRLGLKKDICIVNKRIEELYDEGRGITNPGEMRRIINEEFKDVSYDEKEAYKAVGRLKRKYIYSKLN